ncbi:small acid-soluble spore protein O (minor) [Evansella caseinilytica]|uniref:Small acid-soluble spore protein O n=1 Tax=Evansella caseinilytica TaxID=1503961 RepID=A0A1H3T0A8_9BACI|nr:small acid-soluble spore protein O [Evansella caseinilytica]SDZ43318.1 small acid-soluble spore protein O (minor) [Evansella caseinilytica]
MPLIKKENKRPGMNDAKTQGGGIHEDGHINDPITPEARQFNKKTKKRQ